MIKWSVVAIFMVLALLIGRRAVANDMDVLKGYKAMGQVAICQDVMKPCIAMLEKNVPIFFAVFSEEGKLLAVTRMLDGVETVVWGKLPLRVGEKEL